MNSDLRQFATRYLSIVFATLMSVSFFAFLVIPYSLGGHPGEERDLANLVQVSTSMPQQASAETPSADAKV